MITEYLFEERKITLEKFLDEDFDLENINKKKKKKYCAQQREDKSKSYQFNFS